MRTGGGNCFVYIEALATFQITNSFCVLRVNIFLTYKSLCVEIKIKRKIKRVVETLNSFSYFFCVWLKHIRRRKSNKFDDLV
jgi:hypothetical protein